MNATRPKGFSENELATLSVSFVAVGRWDYVGLSETEGRHLIIHFFKCLQGNPEDGVRASYLSLQNTFMALQRNTFEAIQSEPPFSRFGRRNMKALVRAWAEGGEAGFTAKWREIFCSGWRTREISELPARVKGGSGEKPEDAIEILTDERGDKINGEYWYLYYTYGRGWERGIQMSTIPDESGRRYDILHIDFHDGQRKRLHFLLCANHHMSFESDFAFAAHLVERLSRCGSTHTQSVCRSTGR
jgi:hypothetical protein